MGKLLGTLIVVVLKAKNLPNKQRIGKQDPYCSVALNTDRKRTQTVKKGGQTPEWDAELRFEVWQDMQDEMQAEITATGGVRPAAQDPAKQRINKSNSASGKKVLNISVWADDPKDPDLVGDATVDLTEPLKLGEWDEWVSLMFKGKYAGEVFLELTFYSAAPEPKKRVVGPAAGEFEPVAFPSDHQPQPQPTPSASTSSRPAKVISRPDLPAGLRPGASTATSRLSVSQAASSLGVSATPGSRPSSRQQLRHSVSGDLSEFGRQEDHSERNRRASYLGPASTSVDQFPPLRHPFDPNAYLEEPTPEQNLPPPPATAARPVSGTSHEKPLPQPQQSLQSSMTQPVPPQHLPQSFSSPSVYQTGSAANSRPLPVPGAAPSEPPQHAQPQPFDLRQQMHQLTLSASQPSLEPQTYPSPYTSPPPTQPIFQQSPSPHHMSPVPYQPSHSPIHQYGASPVQPYGPPHVHSPVHSHSAPPPPLPPRPISAAPPAPYGHQAWSPSPYQGYTSPPPPSVQHQQPIYQPQSHIPSYEAAYGSAFGVPSASIPTSGTYQPTAPPRPTSYTSAPASYYTDQTYAPPPPDYGQHHGRPLPVPDPSISGGWSQQQTHEYLRQRG